MKTLNKNKNKSVIVLITLAIGLLLGWMFFENKDHAEELHKHEHSENIVWTCSMHPQIRQNEEGQCPICGMDLIPINNDNHGDGPNGIKMSKTAMELANIQTLIVSKQKPKKEVKLNGKVKIDERRINSQSAHIPGRIEKLLVNFTGEYIEKGQIFAYIYSPELVTAQEELFETKKVKDTQPELYQAAIEKLRNWKLTNEQISQILESNVKQELFPIVADISGVVLNKNVNLGDYVKKGQTIYEIASLSKVWVLFDIYESDMPWVKVGDRIEFTVQSIPGETFNGTISFIDPIINSKTRVASARIEISNPKMRLKPEMFTVGVVESSIGEDNEEIIIPKSAVMWTGERSIVYIKVVNEDAINFVMREVTLGKTLGDSYIIKSGLESGDEIATNGTFSIDAASQLAGKPSMMNQEGGAVAMHHNHVGSMHHKHDENMQQATNHDSNSKNIIISKEERKELSPLFNNYLKLKNALVGDDLDNAMDAAQQMNTSLSKVNMKVFTDDVHHVWMKHNNVLKKELSNANNSKDIKSMRSTFKNISDQMVVLIKTFGAVDYQDIYIDYCPMANNNEGAEWLSTEKIISNPYFGSSMLRCGEVRREIKGTH